MWQQNQSDTKKKKEKKTIAPGFGRNSFVRCGEIYSELILGIYHQTRYINRLRNCVIFRDSIAKKLQVK